MRLRSASTLGAILALTCAFSAGSRAHTTIPRGEPTPTIDCQSRLQVIPDRNFPPPFRGRGYAAAGPLHLTAWFRDEPRSQFRPEAGNAMKRIKAPVFVEAGPAVTVELVGKSARRAEIEIGLDRGASARSSSVRFVPCPPDATVAERR